MLSYHIDAAARRITVTGSGRLTAADIVESQNRIRLEPAFDPAFGMLIDYRLVTAFDLSEHDVRRVAAGSPSLPTARRAVVVADLVGFGLARMFQIFTDLANSTGTVRVFRDDLDAAMRWISE